MNRNVLRRQSLLDDAAHLVFGDGRQSGVVAVEERQSNVFVLDEKRRPRISRIAVTETENTRVGTLSRDDLLEREAEILSLGALELDFPVFTVLLAHFEHELGFPGGMETKVEIVADDAPVDFYEPVARFEVDFGAQAVRRHLGNLDPAAANACNCRCNCKLVHNRHTVPQILGKSRHWSFDPTPYEKTRLNCPFRCSSPWFLRYGGSPGNGGRCAREGCS